MRIIQEHDMEPKRDIIRESDAGASDAASVVRRGQDKQNVSPTKIETKRQIDDMRLQAEEISLQAKGKIGSIVASVPEHTEKAWKEVLQKLPQATELQPYLISYARSADGNNDQEMQLEHMYDALEDDVKAYAMNYDDQLLHYLKPKKFELQEEDADAHELAYIDPMTGVYNYHGYKVAAEASERYIAYCEQNQQTPQVILSVSDGDFFKMINLLAGRTFGNVVIRKAFGIAEHHMLQELVRMKQENEVPDSAQIVSSRTGGEEFFRLFLGVSEPQYQKLIEGLRLEIMEQVQLQISELEGATIGSATEVFLLGLQKEKGVKLRSDEIGGSTYVAAMLDAKELTTSSFGLNRLRKAASSLDEILSQKKNTGGKQARNTSYPPFTISWKELSGSEKQADQGATIPFHIESPAFSAFYQEVSEEITAITEGVGLNLKRQNRKRLRDIVESLPLSDEMKEEHYHTLVRYITSSLFEGDLTTMGLDEASIADINQARRRELFFLRQTNPLTKYLSEHEWNEQKEQLEGNGKPYLELSLEMGNLKVLNETLGSHELANGFASMRAMLFESVLSQVLSEHGLSSQKIANLKQTSNFFEDRILLPLDSLSEKQQLAKVLETTLKPAFLELFDHEVFKRIAYRVNKRLNAKNELVPVTLGKDDARGPWTLLKNEHMWRTLAPTTGLGLLFQVKAKELGLDRKLVNNTPVITDEERTLTFDFSIIK